MPIVILLLVLGIIVGALLYQKLIKSKSFHKFIEDFEIKDRDVDKIIDDEKELKEEARGKYREIKEDQKRMDKDLQNLHSTFFEDESKVNSTKYVTVNLTNKGGQNCD